MGALCNSGALCDPKVFRGGVSQQRLVYETSDISVSASGRADIEFSIAAAGRGYTRISVAIGPKDFDGLVEAMSASDRHTAKRAMSGELQRQISEQPDFDKQVARTARASLLTRAEDRWLANGGSEDWRYAVCSEVKCLIEEEEND